MVLPELKSASLVSLGQLCDDGCTVVLTKPKLYAMKNNKVILQGDRNHRDGLWDINIANSTMNENYCLPPVHAAMYTNKMRKSIAPEPSRSKKKIVPIAKNPYDIDNISINKLTKAIEK